MAGRQEQLEAVIEAFQRAGAGTGDWMQALAGLAALTGSRSAELVGFGGPAAAPYNLMTNGDPEANAQFVAMGGYDPELNPRVRAGVRAPELRDLACGDIIRDDDLGSPVLEQFAQHDIPHSVQTTLIRRSETLIGMSILRRRAEGPADADQRRLFAAVAPHARSAVLLNRALNDRGAALMAAAMDAVDLAVFVLDRLSRVSAVSAGAEALLRADDRLRLRNGELRLAHPAASRELAERIGLACRGAPQAPTPSDPVVLPQADGRDPLVLDVARAPCDSHGFAFAPAALVIARRPRRPAGRAAVLAQRLFGLTPVEAEIVADLVCGMNIDAIAKRRRVGASTVRSHLRSTFAKAGVNKQIELVARVNALL
jgi:DNA-binding CsgD family transcriptional regulator/PAS domain-containing protein